jgi:hypothetical protein
MAKSQHHRPPLALLAWWNHPQVSANFAEKIFNILTKQKGTCRENKKHINMDPPSTHKMP